MAIKYSFSKEQVSDIITRYNNQESLASIAKIYQCSVNPIKRILEENNVELRGTKSIDLTQVKFKNFKPIKKLDKRNKRGEVIWQCLCNCGKIFEASAYDLKVEKIRACHSCVLKEMGERYTIDLTNQKFNHLTALYKTDKRDSGSVVWHCICDCPNHTEIDVSARNLVQGHTQSCGCIKSYGEQIITKLLIKNNIKFTTQKTFDDCRLNLDNPRSKLKFDFYILDLNYCIEYDGEQHFNYRENDYSWNTKENYELTKQRDQVKNQWCKDNNIPLIRIPYTHLKDLCIEDLLLETSKFIV